MPTHTPPRVTRRVPVRLALCLLTGSLTACASVPQPPEDLAIREAPGRERFASNDGSTQTEGDVTGEWLASFGDPTLVALATEAMEHNPDLRLAAGVWAEAQARLKVARSYLSPQVDLGAGASRSRISTAGRLITDTRYSIEGQAGWEVDLWGRLRSSSEAARASLEASELDYAAARQSLAASVADAWFLIIQAHEKLAIDRDQLAAEHRTADVTRDKVETGVGTQLEAELTESNVALAQAAVTGDLAAIDELTKTLEALLGRYPSAELDVAHTLPPFPGSVAVGLPSELLERRPDVLAADRRVASAFHSVSSAKAARLPSLTLTGSLGAVLDPSHSIWSIGGNLLAPIFNGGRLDAQVRIADAQQEQALAGYVGVAIDAFREVETAMASEQYLAQRETELKRASDRLRTASQVGEDRYNAGILSIVDLMTIRRQDFQSRVELLQVRTNRLRQRLTLYRALGGSFDENDVSGRPAQAGTTDGQEQAP